MKAATTVLALLVALLLFMPAPVSAAGLPTFLRAGAPAALEQEAPGVTPPPIAEGSEPASTEPVPTEPAPTEPAPTEPAPTEPAPTEPAPTEPAPPQPPAEEAGSGIAELHATAGRLRGRVELGWRVDENAGEGNFVVERSTNGSSWRPVKACSMSFDPEQSDYDCTDTRLTSGTTYTYRICLTAKGSTCANVTPSEAVTVKAP